MNESSKQPHAAAIRELHELTTTLGNVVDLPAKILRLHALTEFYLERLITLRMNGGSAIANDDRFTYYHKLQIVSALGVLSSEVVGCLRKLSKLRNRCAHERRPEIGHEELNALGRMLGPKFDEALANVGGDPKEFTAVSWVLFTELTMNLVPFEVVAEQLRVRQK